MSGHGEKLAPQEPDWAEVEAIVTAMVDAGGGLSAEARVWARDLLRDAETGPPGSE